MSVTHRVIGVARGCGADGWELSTTLTDELGDDSPDSSVGRQLAGCWLAAHGRRQTRDTALPAGHLPVHADRGSAATGRIGQRRRLGHHRYPNLGVDAVLAELRTAGAAAPGEPRLAAMHAVVRGQAHHLRDREAVGNPGFVPRQLCLQAAELGETFLAADCRTRQLASDDPGRVLQWTTRRASPALILELGRDESAVVAVAVLPDGRVVTGGGLGGGGRVLAWDPARPGVGPVELGRHEGAVEAVAVLPDGVLVWDAAQRGPVELGRHEGAVWAVAVLPDGQVVTSGSVGRSDRVLVWDPARPGTGPVELGGHEGGCGRWRCCRTGRWSPAATTTGCGCRMCRAVHSHAPHTRLLLPSAHLELASSSVGHAAGGISCWEVRQRHRTRLRPGNVRVTLCVNRRERPQVRVEGRAVFRRL